MKEEILLYLRENDKKIIFSEETLKNIDFEFIKENYPDLIFGFSSENFERNEDFEREFIYFSGEIDTKKIKNIVFNYNWFLFLDNEKYYKKIEEICEKQDNWCEVFLELTEKNDEKFFEKMLEIIADSENVSLVWFSTKIEENLEKINNFKTKFAPNWYILFDIKDFSSLKNFENKADIFII